jgi:long-chain acyl-CoA synthetase
LRLETLSSLVNGAAQKFGDLPAFIEDSGTLSFNQLRHGLLKLVHRFSEADVQVEAVIASHPAVSVAAVTGQPDRIKGEIAKAYVVLRLTKFVSEADSLAQCRTSPAAYKVSRAIEFFGRPAAAIVGKGLAASAARSISLG